jgi:hypothetical protein
MLEEMYGLNWEVELERMTTFKGTDGKMVAGKTTPYELGTRTKTVGGETRTGVTYTKVRDEYKKWKEARDGDNQ